MGEARNKARQRQQSLRANRLVIIEWLDDAEQHTGSELAGRLRARNGHFLPVELMPCSSATEVHLALSRIADEIPRKGIPVLHIEAHGDCELTGFVGPNGHGEQEIILWEDLREPLRRINLRTRFNLLVVAAACLSEAILFAIDYDKPLPFVAVVSFRTTVTPRSLREAMLELYRSLVVNKLTLDACEQNANRELIEGEQLRFTSAPRLIEGAAHDMLNRFKKKDDFDDYYYRMTVNSRLNGDGSLRTPAEVARVARLYAPRVLEEMQSRLLALELIPENRARFGFDTMRMIRHAERSREWSG